jgi:hypothetical protein
MKKLNLILAILIGASTLQIGCKNSLIIAHPELRSERRAILVLPGMRSTARGFRANHRFYRDRGVDVYVLNYYSTEGIEGNVENLSALIEEHRIDEYDELYVFTYILGSWVVNNYLRDHELPNLRRVIYDRSRYQEQVAGIVLEKIPSIIDTFYGVTVEEFHEMPYPSFERGEQQVDIGIIIECRASPIARRNRDMLTPIPGSDWVPESFGQVHDDAMYVFLHHDEMYYSFDVIGDEILHFFEHGRFSDDARRTRCTEDPFSRRR